MLLEAGLMSEILDFEGWRWHLICGRKENQTVELRREGPVHGPESECVGELARLVLF